MSPFIVGLTGGIGSGKTTVSREFEARGITVVDADVVARQVVAAGSPLLAKVAETYGKQVLQRDGTLNRAALREIIFNDDTAKQQLNALMHPVIREEMITQLQAAQSPYVILSAPLLLENGLDAFCHRVLVVDVTEATQIQRTIERDQVERSQVEAILKAQVARDERLRRADDVIDNDGTVDNLEHQLESLHRSYLALAEQADYHQLFSSSSSKKKDP